MQFKFFAGTHGYKLAYLGIVFTTIFLPSLLILPLFIFVLSSPVLTHKFLYDSHRYVFLYLVLFICAQYVFNVPGVANLSLSVCGVSDACYGCDFRCVLEVFFFFFFLIFFFFYFFLIFFFKFFLFFSFFHF